MADPRPARLQLSTVCRAHHAVCDGGKLGRGRFAMNELKKKERIESRISKLQERVEASENKKIDEDDKFLSIVGENEAKFTQEIVALEAGERWANERLALAEANVELAKIELDISIETMRTDESTANRLKFEAGIAEAKVSHAEAKVCCAGITERLAKLHFSRAPNEKEREQCGRLLENASENYRNANLKLRIALKELELLSTDPNETETSGSHISGRFSYFTLYLLDCFVADFQVV
jgi:hypothetical protein